MTDDSRQLLNDILCQWHNWCRSYSAVKPVSAGPGGIHGMGTKAFDAYYSDLCGVDQRGLLAWTLARVSENEFREAR